MPSEKETHATAPARLANFGYRRVREEEKPGLVQEHFDTVAKRYDFSNSVLSLGVQHRWKRIAVAMMDLKSGDRVLDVCGGTGDLALRAAAATGPSGNVVLYDFNRSMIEVGVRKISASPQRDRISFIQGDAESLALADQTFDAVMVGFGIRNLTHMEQGLREIYRLLKPGGTFMCLEFSSPPSTWFRRLYDFYSFHVMPRVGQILVGSRKAYTYLPESIRVFPGPDELIQILRRLGFERVHYRFMTGGIAVVYLAGKTHAGITT